MRDYCEIGLRMKYDKYLLLTEFEVRTASNGKKREKRGSVAYSTDRENELGKIFIKTLRLIGRAGKEAFKLSGPYSEIRPEKFTNHTARTN